MKNFIFFVKLKVYKLLTQIFKIAMRLIEKREIFVQGLQ